jgi:hypothetical protein
MNIHKLIRYECTYIRVKFIIISDRIIFHIFPPSFRLYAITYIFINICIYIYVHKYIRMNLYEFKSSYKYIIVFICIRISHISSKFQALCYHLYSNICVCTNSNIIIHINAYMYINIYICLLSYKLICV